MNALKSGIDANSQIIRGENAANLEALKTEYHDRFRPTTPEQRMLVDTLIDAEWLLRRFRVCEAQLWDHGAQFPYRQPDETAAGQAFRTSLAFFDRLQSRIDAAHRNYRNALKELQRLQAEQAEEDRTPDPDPTPALHATARNQTPKPANGFVPPNPAPNPAEDPSAPPPPPPANPSDPPPLA